MAQRPTWGGTPRGGKSSMNAVRPARICIYKVRNTPGAQRIVLQDECYSDDEPIQGSTPALRHPWLRLSHSPCSTR